MEAVKWNDFFGQEHVFIEGKDDDVFHIIPHKRDEEGNSFTEILSKKAILELAKKLEEK